MKKTMILSCVALCCASIAQAEAPLPFKPVGYEEPKPAAAVPAPVKPPEEEPAPAPAAPVDPAAEAAKKGWVTFSSAVNVIRKIDRTEIVFRNGDSYYLPSGKRYNELYKACEESERTGQALSVTVSPQSRIIMAIGGGAKAGQPGQAK